MRQQGLLEVTLDDALFRVLSSDSRREILRLLQERRMTGTELAQRLDLGKPAVSEHLKKLHEAGLVDRHDDPERRWVYFSLSSRGHDILEPRRTRFILVLGVAVVALLIGSALGMALYGTVDGPVGGPEGGGADETGIHAVPGSAGSVPPGAKILLPAESVDLRNGTFDASVWEIIPPEPVQNDTPPEPAGQQPEVVPLPQDTNAGSGFQPPIDPDALPDELVNATGRVTVGLPTDALANATDPSSGPITTTTVAPVPTGDAISGNSTLPGLPACGPVAGTVAVVANATLNASAGTISEAVSAPNASTPAPTPTLTTTVLGATTTSTATPAPTPTPVVTVAPTPNTTAPASNTTVEDCVEPLTNATVSGLGNTTINMTTPEVVTPTNATEAAPEPAAAPEPTPASVVPANATVDAPAQTPSGEAEGEPAVTPAVDPAPTPAPSAAPAASPTPSPSRLTSGDDATGEGAPADTSGSGDTVNVADAPAPERPFPLVPVLLVLGLAGLLAAVMVRNRKRL